MFTHTRLNEKPYVSTIKNMQEHIKKGHLKVISNFKWPISFDKIQNINIKTVILWLKAVIFIILLKAMRSIPCVWLI